MLRDYPVAGWSFSTPGSDRVKNLKTRMTALAALTSHSCLSGSTTSITNGSSIPADPAAQRGDCRPVDSVDQSTNGSQSLSSHLKTGRMKGVSDFRSWALEMLISKLFLKPVYPAAPWLEHIEMPGLVKPGQLLNCLIPCFTAFLWFPSLIASHRRRSRPRPLWQLNIYKSADSAAGDQPQQ